MKTKRPYIEHFVMELFDIEMNLEKKENLDKEFEQLIKELNLGIVSECFHNFIPTGFTCIFILSQSHLSFHSWPELKYLNIDLMSCEKLLNINKIKGTKVKIIT